MESPLLAQAQRPQQTRVRVQPQTKYWFSVTFEVCVCVCVWLISFTHNRAEARCFYILCISLHNVPIRKVNLFTLLVLQLVPPDLFISTFWSVCLLRSPSNEKQ